MIRQIITKYYQFIELWEREGFLPACKFSIYRYEEAVLVEKDLSTLAPLKQPEGGDDFKLIELSGENFQSSDVVYMLKSRKEKLIVNTGYGYRTYVLVKNNQVVADLWYVAGSAASASPIRKYLDWFGIELKPEEAYLFDMFFLPNERGKGMSTFFMGSVLRAMREKGFKKVYGYFDSKNIPALWVHRLLGYKELLRFIIRKMLVYETARAKP